MNPVEQRPLTLAEERALRKIAQRRTLVTHAKMAFAIFGFVAALGLVGIRCAVGPTGIADKAVVATFAAVLALSALQGLERAARPQRARLTADLAGGLAEVETLDAVDALRLHDYDGYYPSYYLALADGRTLFLGGSYLYGRESDFPSTRFALTRAPRSRIPLGVESRGDRLQPSAELFADGLDMDGDRLRIPDDGTIVGEDLASLRQRLPPAPPLGGLDPARTPSDP